MLFKNHHDDKENLRIIVACCPGEVIPLENLSNDAFSSLILGDGFGVIADKNSFNSPSAGVIKDISDNKHEITIKSDDGFILIVSVGADSDNNNIEADCLVNLADRVGPDTKLWDIDVDYYKEKGIDVIAAVVVTNTAEIPAFNINYGKIKDHCQPVMTIPM